MKSIFMFMIPSKARKGNFLPFRCRDDKQQAPRCGVTDNEDKTEWRLRAFGEAGPVLSQRPHPSNGMSAAVDDATSFRFTACTSFCPKFSIGAMANSTTPEPLKLPPGFIPGQDPLGTLVDETATWLSTQRECCQICPDLRDEGIVIEWSNFDVETESTFGAVRNSAFQGPELCLNLAGHGSLCYRESKLKFEPLTAFVYPPDGPDSCVSRKRGERHRFLTIGFSASFLGDQLAVCEEALHPVVRAFMHPGNPLSNFGTPIPLMREHGQLISLLLRPQCSQGPCRVRCKGIVLQLMADFLVRPCCGNDSQCDRQKCLALERARKVVGILQRDLANPPALEKIGHEVGCSPFHLSRTFSREMGMTIPQCLRTLRMRYAAELLKCGKCNVTEAAMAVGYSSLSHFSQAFCQATGCYPAAYSASSLDRASTAGEDRCSDGNALPFKGGRQSSSGVSSGIDVLLNSVR